jgi:hypothetical protein
MRKPVQMSVCEYFSRVEDIHALMKLFPADGGLNAVLVEDERLNIFNTISPKGGKTISTHWETTLWVVRSLT